MLQKLDQMLRLRAAAQYAKCGPWTPVSSEAQGRRRVKDFNDAAMWGTGMSAEITRQQVA